MSIRLLGAAAMAVLLMAAAYQSGSAPAAVPAPAADEAQHALGRKVYNFRCYFCHGYSGDAKTLAATYLIPPPRDFTGDTATTLSPQAVLQAVRHGRPGTAMKPFTGIIDDTELQAVAAFVSREFVQHKLPNTAYHTAENGWPDHQRFEVAFAFARGQLALDTPIEALDARQRQGRAMFLGSCISCHDRARVTDEGPAWSSRPVSFPRMGFVPGQAQAAPPDVVSSASVYAKHEVVPRVKGLSPQLRRGETLFQANCAFCHGGDGTGKNWIGQFMEPKARDLTAYTAKSLPPARLRQVIREGLPDTSMPAWQHVLKPAEIDAIAAYVTRVFFQPLP